MELAREDGSGNDYFKPTIETFKLYKGTEEISSKMESNTEGDIIKLIPVNVLDANTDYKVVTRVSFSKLVGNSWVPYVDNGQPVEEKKENTFKTGAAPDTLDYDLLQRLYPFFNQRNFYKDEPNKGVIKLNQKFHAFFIKFAKWKVKIENLAGSEMGTSYATTVDDSLFTFNLPASLDVNTQYRFLLLGEGPNSPADDVNKPGLKFTFTTSGYATLAAKINALRVVQPIVGRLSSDVIDLQAEVGNYEGFELYEIAGNKYTDYKPMIRTEANTTNELYYNNIIKDLVYTPFPYYDPVKGVTIQVTETESLRYGLPPVKAITPSWYYVNTLGSGQYSDVLKRRMPYVYNLNKYYNLHFLELRKKLINTYLNYTGVIVETGATGYPVQFTSLLTQGFPFILKGKYKVKFSFVQLDGTVGTTGEFMYENPIE
jgi:hypothetical protein